tara:strand:- start:234 stop:473 length:240 start_codon:yes stop_codon:yes gene_type:complete
MNKTPKTNAYEFIAQPGMMPPFNTVPSSLSREIEEEAGEEREKFYKAIRNLRDVQGRLNAETACKFLYDLLPENQELNQ